MDLWAGMAIAGVIGFGVGALVVWAIGRKQVGGTSVSALKQEHERFREQVTTHFVETAELINRLTDSYKDVFDHLSKGAETLVDDKSLRERMPQVSDQEVRLKRIGSRSASEEGTKSDAGAKASMREGNRPSSGPSRPTASAGVSRPGAAARPTDSESGGRTPPNKAADASASAKNQSTGSTAGTAGSDGSGKSGSSARTDSASKADKG